MNLLYFLVPFQSLYKLFLDYFLCNQRTEEIDSICLLEFKLDKMIQKKRTFDGFNLERIKRNIEEFKEKLGDRFIEAYVVDNNPKWVIIVEYWEDELY